MKFCGEIVYMTERGWVHSDVCHQCSAKDDGSALSEESREFYHQLLDEWLNKSNGAGFFWLGKNEDIWENFKEQEE